jgi:hypothetical protein
MINSARRASKEEGHRQAQVHQGVQDSLDSVAFLGPEVLEERRIHSRRGQVGLEVAVAAADSTQPTLRRFLSKLFASVTKVIY